MLIAVPREVHAGERRVATTPEVVKQLLKLGYEVAIETNAGSAANFADESYIEAGASIENDVKALWDKADIIFKVRAPEQHPDLDVD